MSKLKHKLQENAELNDLEREAKLLNEGILEKAKMQRLEQEDEIKHLNELMLNAKCHAIRDAQVLEREEIKRDIQVGCLHSLGPGKSLTSYI